MADTRFKLNKVEAISFCVFWPTHAPISLMCQRAADCCCIRQANGTREVLNIECLPALCGIDVRLPPERVLGHPTMGHGELRYPKSETITCTRYCPSRTIPIYTMNQLYVPVYNKL